jgi:hypothetical protein
MNHTISFVPEVENDILVAYDWYESKSPGLGEEYLRVFYACVFQILKNPLLFPNSHSFFRRVLFRRFPFAVYYTVDNNQVTVFGVFHCARDPRIVSESLEGREELSP